ncbi:transporter substrate-binding domain-containing protein [Bradyrhizobium sp. WSM 1738]|uniref:transporter substrate-binding domain-containing protein n=1 Tax=Bradyrhizobium hereditatis TaxID=2821405 RepID=UPI001CE303AA|nr:transporter substrate-binding domain-containing protein [Bradyrhizobium hereditatis]MCA6120135.1 transporter substrate-binding domain-containing protein [Bradyrhizobium hereditatis]
MKLLDHCVIRIAFDWPQNGIGICLIDGRVHPRFQWIVTTSNETHIHFGIPKFSLLVTSCYSFPSFPQPESSLLDSMRKGGEVKVAFGLAPPLVVVSPSGELKGYTVDIVKLSVRRKGAPAVTPVLTAWDAQLPLLLAHRGDLVASGLQITENCCEVAVFSTFAVPAGYMSHPETWSI